MSDTIYRQAAIDAVSKGCQEWRGIFSRCEENILAIPSARSERELELDGTESNIEILSELRAMFNCFDEAEEPVYRALSDAICSLSAQPEITQKDVEQYCHKRCLTVITNDLFHEMSARFAAQPERKQVEIEYTEWNEELYGQSAICGNCGCTWQIGNNGEDNFCPNCGARMIRGGKDNDE